MGELSSFYGGRRGFSFILTKTFDGYDIPQPDTDPTITDYTYGKAYYAIDSNRKFIITDRDHGGNVPVDEVNDKYLIKRDGTNYSSQNWLDHDNDGSLIDDSVYHFPIVIAQGLKQCFEKGAASLNEVAFSDYVIIDSVVNMCNWDDPDNGKIYQRGGDPNNMYKEKYICQITGPKGDSIINELDHYENVEEEEPYLDIVYSETAGDLIPGKEINEGTTVYNDTIHFAYRYVYNSLGNIEKCLIGFKLPTLVDDFSAKHSKAYDEHGNILDPDTELISRDTNFYHNDKWDHPFYQKWNIKIPKGIHGINSKDFELVPTKTKPAGFGSTSFTGTQAYTDVALTPPGVLLTDSYDTLRDANFPVKDDQGTVYPNIMAVMYNGDKLYVAKNDCYKNILRYKEINYDQHESGDITYYELDFFESGHRIVDQNGVELEQRSKLKFEGDRVEVTDDAINDITKVKVLAETPERLGIGYGICSTASSTLEKEATLNGYNLTTNGVVAIKFEHAVPANSKLSINNQNAKPIFYKGAAIVDKVIKAGNTATFYYDGVHYQLVAVDNPSGGHVILDTEEQELQQREKLWFKDALITDSTEEEATTVEIMHSPMSLADYNAATNLSDGIYPIEDDIPTDGGHIILNSNGIEMPARRWLQFYGLSVSDDEANNKTIITKNAVQANWTQTITTAEDYIKNKPTLATVATSGSYNDLSNKPTIPTVNNATLTIQKNGTTIKTFTANASSNVTCNITVPTNTNELTNGAGFITSSGSCAYATSAGSAGSATKATQDGSGNTITSTYVKKSGDTMTGSLSVPVNCSFSATGAGNTVSLKNGMIYFNQTSGGYSQNTTLEPSSTVANRSITISLPQKSGTLPLISDNNYFISFTHNYGIKIGSGTMVTDLNSNTTLCLCGNDISCRKYSSTNTYTTIYASNFSVQSSRLVKENINAVSEEDAKKILDLNVVDFDYIEEVGGATGQTGLIAEDTLNIYPNLVQIPDNYNEKEAEEKIKNGEFVQVPSIDYSKFVPYLIKMIQIQQKEIDELKEMVITK